MKIRPATHADDVVSIWCEVYQADHVTLLPDGVELPFEPRGECYVAGIDEVAAAFIYIDMQWLDELWVHVWGAQHP